LKPAVYFLFLLLSYSLSAHESNKAFFNINVEKDSVIVDIEFPWTIDEAFLIAYPAYDTIESPNEYLMGFQKYIDENLSMLTVTNRKLKMLGIEKMLVKGHAHQVNYRIYYDFGKIHEVKNTTMFNLNVNQENYHLLDGDTQIHFITTPENESFLLENKKSKILMYGAASAGLIVITLIIFRLGNTKPNNT